MYHNFLVVVGDFNAQIGPEDAPFAYNKETNRNGQKLVDFAEEFQLTVTNTKFMKPFTMHMQVPKGNPSKARSTTSPTNMQQNNTQLPAWATIN